MINKATLLSQEAICCIRTYNKYAAEDSISVKNPNLSIALTIIYCLPKDMVSVINLNKESRFLYQFRRLFLKLKQYRYGTE